MKFIEFTYDGFNPVFEDVSDRIAFCNSTGFSELNIIR